MIARRKFHQSPQAEPRFFYGYIVVAAALCAVVAIWGTYNAFGIFFKPVLTEFGWTRAMTSGAFSLSMITHGLLSVVMGGLTDRFGPRLVMTLSGFLLGLGYLLMSQISTVWQLYLFYGVIIGAGMGGSFVPPVSMVARWFLKRRGMMTGIVLAGTGVGTLIAAPVADRLIATYDWRLSYIILGSILLVVVVLAAQLLKRDPTQAGQVPYGENERREPGAIIEVEGFSLSEAVRTRQFWTACAILFCFGFSMFAVMVHIVAHATEVGISAATAANILATIGGLSIVGRVVLGSATDRIGSRQVLIIGFILIAAALLWLMPATQVWVLYIFAIAFGFAQGGMGASESPLVAWLFGLRAHGLIFGVTAIGFSTGAAISPFLAGYIFDVTGTYKMALLVCAVISVIGLVLTILLKPTKRS